MRATISVNPFTIKQNALKGRSDPVIRVHTYRKSYTVQAALIDGPSQVVYEPTRKQHGASCFIVCDAKDVKLVMA